MLEEVIRTRPLKPREILPQVGPVSPYPRIDPQQPKQEGYTRSQADTKTEQESPVRRRFTAMRRLIDQLKELAQVFRVDYTTADKEMQDQGLAITEEILIDQLLKLKISLTSIEELLQQLRQHSSGITLGPGQQLSSGRTNLFPVHSEGLSEYLLRFADLQIKIGPNNRAIVEEINNEGRFVFEQDRLRLNFRRFNSLTEPTDDALRLNISVLVGAIETDETGRRAILYPRPKQDFGLYADKQIDLSI